MCIQAVDNEVKATITQKEDSSILQFYKLQGSNITGVLVNGEEVVINNFLLSSAFGKGADIVLTGGVAEYNGIQFVTLDGARKAAVAGSIIKLIDNCYLIQKILIMKELTIDLNGYGLYGDANFRTTSAGASALLVDSTNEGNLNIVDSMSIIHI